MPHPILYSLQNCPYAMRARMGILLAKQPVRLRAINLKNKPLEMLAASPKGTVPVLVFEESVFKNAVFDNSKTQAQSMVIDESLEIMLWALRQNDPDNLLYNARPDQVNEPDQPNEQNQLPTMLRLIDRFDNEFKTSLENYKCAKRYHEDSKIDYRQQCEVFIVELENCLTRQKYLIGDKPSLADYAILPYIRQFARVERQWYKQAPYPYLQNWLKTHLTSTLFSKTMTKYPLWSDNQESFLIGTDCRR